MDISFLEKERQVTFEWHFAQALKWLKFDNRRQLDNVLVYASLELRCAIERYIFEFLVLLKEKLTTEDEERCRSIRGIFDLMKETDPFYRKTAEFTKLIFVITPNAPELVIVDTSYLRNKWEELSTYCHKQLAPSKTFRSPSRAFQKKGYKLISDVISRLNIWRPESVCGLIRPSTMPPETREVYEKYIRNEIDDRQAKRMLDLMQPVLNYRLRQKRLTVAAKRRVK